MYQIAGICIVQDMIGVLFLGVDSKSLGFCFVSGGKRDIDTLCFRRLMIMEW